MSGWVWRVAAALLLTLGGAETVRAAEPTVLEWADLLPGDAPLEETLESLSLIEHAQAADAPDHSRSTLLATEYEGRTVKLPGFIVPLEYEGTHASSFLLVPYIGACIHVPPPPANQIVLVTADPPIDIAGMFAPVWVTGPMTTGLAETELAEVGYKIAADRVDPYRY